jgi:hypothetical protein
MNCRDDFGVGAERQHHDGNAMAHNDGKILAQSRVGPMTDKIDRVRGGAALQLAFDLAEVCVESRGRAGIERRQGADDSGAALRDDEIRRGGDEHRPGHDGKRELGHQLRGEVRIAAHFEDRKAMRP